MIIKKLSVLPVEDVAQKLGIIVKNHKALCFIHDDHKPSLNFSAEKNIYFCFVCGRGGGPIQLVMDYDRCTFQEACIWLGNEFNIWKSAEKTISKSENSIVDRKNITKEKKEKKEKLIFDEELFSWLINKAQLSNVAKEFLFNERYYNEEVIKQLKIKSVNYPKRVIDALIAHFGRERCLNSGIVRLGKNGLYFYFFTPCLLFPYYDKDGQLIGIQSRYLGANKGFPRFQFLSSQKTRMFNLPVLNTINRGETVYISEGITDCIALLSFGMKAVAIPSATILPEDDLILLKDYDLHMFPDRDESGAMAYNKLRRFFINNYSAVKLESLPEGVKDYSEYYIKKQNGSIR